MRKNSRGDKRARKRKIKGKRWGGARQKKKKMTRRAAVCVQIVMLHVLVKEDT